MFQCLVFNKTLKIWVCYYFVILSVLLACGWVESFKRRLWQWLPTSNEGTTQVIPSIHLVLNFFNPKAIKLSPCRFISVVEEFVYLFIYLYKREKSRSILQMWFEDGSVVEEYFIVNSEDSEGENATGTYSIKMKLEHNIHNVCPLCVFWYED